MKQLHPTHLTQGPVALRYFWEGGQARFPVLSFSPHSTCSWWGSYKTLKVASQGVRRQPAVLAVLGPQENYEWRSGLAVNGLYHRDKASYRGHCYVLQNVLIMQAVQLTPYTMENSSSFMGDPTPTVDRHTTTAFAGCNALPEVCKLNRPIICFHFQFYDSICLSKD